MIRNLAQSAPGECDHDADVCIIGAGFAGLLAARGLARRGQRVIVLESGARAPDPAGDELNAVDDINGRFAMAVDGRARGFGGTSSRWTGRILPLAPEDFEARPSLGMQGWPITKADLDPYLPEIEKLFSVDRQGYDNEITRFLLLAPAGWRPDADFDCRWPKLPQSSRVNLANVLGPEMRTSRNIDLWLNATVCAHELDPERRAIRAVKAVSADGRSLRIAARHFIYAAGTIESTRLLMLLNRESGERAFAHCDALGAYFQDHLEIEVGKLEVTDVAAAHRWFTYHFIGRSRRSLHLTLSPTAQKAEDIAAAYAMVWPDFQESGDMRAIRDAYRSLKRGFGLAPCVDLARASSLLLRLAAWRLFAGRLYLPYDLGLRLHVCAEQIPDRSNRLALTDIPDRLGVPTVRLEWEPKAADERTISAIVGRLGEFWLRSGFSRFCNIRWASSVREGPHIAHASDFAHPSGSTRMGRDPRTSVVGSDLRCWHVDNASVISASVFPRAGAANPTCTIMQLALRVADTLAV